MVKRIGISNLFAAAEGMDDTEALWQAWLSGETRESDRNWCTWEALTQSALDKVTAALTENERRETDLILATTKGAIQREVAWLRETPITDLRPSFVPDLPTLGNEVARLVKAAGLHGGWCVSTACSSGLTGIMDAAMCVKDEDAGRVVVIGGDVCSEDGFIADGFASLKAVSAKGCSPFDRERDGLKLGSGCGGCIVEAYSQRCACEVVGWGVSNDAMHMTAPDREARGLIQAMRASLEMASLEAKDIDVVFAHGTGTRYNDAMEAVAIENIFLTAGAKPAVTAVKGLIGHTFGGSGIIEGVLAALMIGQQCVPPVTGLRDPERGDIDFVREARPLRVRHVMKLASGFGGMNGVVIFSKGDR